MLVTIKFYDQLEILRVTSFQGQVNNSLVGPVFLLLPLYFGISSERNSSTDVNLGVGLRS